jgi:hypothetical protein
MTKIRWKLFLSIYFIQSCHLCIIKNSIIFSLRSKEFCKGRSIHSFHINGFFIWVDLHLALPLCFLWRYFWTTLKPDISNLKSYCEKTLIEHCCKLSHYISFIRSPFEWCWIDFYSAYETKFGPWLKYRDRSAVKPHWLNIF